MTVSSIVPVNNYSGNGTNKIFDFDFLIENSDELVVTYTSEDEISYVLTEGIDYSIHEVGNSEGSYITFPLDSSSYSVLKQNEIISLSLDLEIKQESQFENSSYLNLNVLEWTFDYIVRLIQILSRKIDRAVKIQEGSSLLPEEIISDIKETRNSAMLYANQAAASADLAEQTKTEVETIYNNALSSCNAAVQEAEDYSDTTLAALERVSDVLAIADNKADISLSNLSSAGNQILDEKLNRTQISDSLLETPLMINYNWDGTTLTIYKGSKGVFPAGLNSDGSKKFNIVELTKNLSYTNVGAGSGLSFVSFYLSSGVIGGIVSFGDTSTNIHSGSTEPSTGQYWYDSTNNVLRSRNTVDEEFAVINQSFPFMRITRATGGTGLITDVINVSQHCGYVGSSVWVTEGVKGLAPNGLNENGTLNHVEITTQNVIVTTNVDATCDYYIGVNATKVTADAVEYYQQDEQPSSSNYIWLNTATNKLYQYVSSSLTDITSKCILVLKAHRTSGYIDSFEAFRPVKIATERYIDERFKNFAVVSENCESSLEFNGNVMRFVITTYTSGLYGYRVWNDNYCEQWGYYAANNHQTNTTVSLLKSFKDTNYRVQLTGTESSGGNDNGAWNVISLTTSNFIAFNTSDNASNIYWEAKGYIS